MRFSGHKNYICRPHWISNYHNSKPHMSGLTKKSSLYWLKSFGLLDKRSNDTDFYKFMMSVDPYLEDQQTLWLLHYKLVTTGYFTTASIFFNDFLNKHFDRFSKYKLCNHISSNNPTINTDKIRKDVDVFIRCYERIISSDIEYIVLNTLLQDLNLIEKLNLDGVSYYYFPVKYRLISWQIIFICLLENFPNKHIFSFKELNIIRNIFRIPSDVILDCLIDAGNHISIVISSYNESYLTINQNINIPDLYKSIYY